MYTDIRHRLLVALKERKKACPFLFALLRPQQVQAMVHRNAINPGAQLRFVAEGIQFSVDLYKYLLNRVLSFLLLLQIAKTQGVNLVAVLVKDVAELQNDNDYYKPI